MTQTPRCGPVRPRRALEGPLAARLFLPRGESFVEFALERPQLFRLMVQRVGDNPQILDAAMATTDARLIRMANQKRLTTDVAFARQSLLALSLGVTTLGRHGASKAEVEAVGRFLLNATLSALVRTKRP